jgi:hypothetical protein
MKKVLFVFCATALMACNDPATTEVDSQPQTEVKEAAPEKVVGPKVVNNEHGGYDTSNAEKIPIASMSATELSDLIQINVRPNLGITYEGYYSLLKIDGQTMLHGPFLAKSESPEVENGVPGRAVFYKGVFYEGVPHDFWSEKVKIVSGSTQEDYNMTMNFDGGACKNITFAGSLNQEMKPRKAEFEGNQVCDFTTTRKKIEIEFLVQQKEALRKK